MKLNAQQIRFCEEYLTDHNGKQAAIRAGYSEHTAKEQASRMLKKPHVRAHLNKLLGQLDERCKTTENSPDTENQNGSDFVLERLHQIDQMDALDILDDEGSLKPLQQWPQLWRQVISSLEISEATRRDGTQVITYKIRWPDKIKNLEMIGRHSQVSAFKERSEESSLNELAERIKNSRERIRKNHRRTDTD